MYFEAGNESLRGQFAIAAIVFNHIKDPRWPKTVVSVIMAGHERGKYCDFSYTCDGLGEGLDHWDSWIKQQELFALAGVVLVIYETTGYYFDPTGGALTYQTVEGEDSGWFGLFDKCTVIGRHKFYCKKKTAAITAITSP